MIEWDVSPVIFSIGPLSLRWYGLLFALGFVAAYHLVKREFLKHSLSVELVDRLLIYMVVGTVVGARLGHCLFYEPAFYLRNPLEILFVWKGGLASHGAAVGMLISIFIYSKKQAPISFWWVLDKIAMTIPLGGAMIRTGNLFNSEIYGRPTDASWAFIFTRVDMLPRHPTQLYEALAYLLTFGVVFWVNEKKKDLRHGLIFGILISSIFTARFFIEFVKANQVGFEGDMPLNMGQLLSIPFIALGLFVAWRSRRADLSRPYKENANKHKSHPKKSRGARRRRSK